MNKLNHIFYDADIHSVTFTRKNTRRHYANLSRASLHRLVYAVNCHANHPDAYIVAMTDGWTLFCKPVPDAPDWEGGYYPADARVLGWEDAQDHRGPNPFTKPALLKAYDEGYADYSAPPAPAPFALVWDGQMASLRRRDGFTVLATMSERTYKRIKQAQDDGADFYELKALFPKKHSVYNA